MRLSLALFFVATTFSSSAVAETDTLDAKTIFQRVNETYRNADSYLDSGFVRLDFANSSRQWTQTGRFKTAYVSPTRFRFEFEGRIVNGDDSSTIIAWQNGDDVQAWWSLKPELFEEFGSVEDALDAAAGVSSDASTIVPGLIVSGMKLGGDIIRLSDPVRIDDDQIDGHDCFRVSGKRWPHDGPTTVWIDKDEFVIRRVHEFDDVQDARVSKTWFYEPSLNTEVDEKLLDYAKPNVSPRIGRVRSGN